MPMIINGKTSNFPVRWEKKRSVRGVVQFDLPPAARCQTAVFQRYKIDTNGISPLPSPPQLPYNGNQ